ncbi:MAG: hypothetical protein FD153_1743, partial [Rhodospirillaceae bacterium]
SEDGKQILPSFAADDIVAIPKIVQERVVSLATA